MTNFTIRKTFLIPSFELDMKEREKLNRFLLLLEESGVEKFFPIKESFILGKGGRPSYNPYDIFSTILYGFAFGSSTLRELETSCKYDLRYFYLMQQERPTHIRFGEFINEVKNGKGKKYNIFNNLIFEGEYLNKENNKRMPFKFRRRLH